MKHKINKKTTLLAGQLNEDFSTLYQYVLETITDDDYTRSEVNFFLRKLLHELLELQKQEKTSEEVVKKNKKKWGVDQNKKFHEWHVSYQKRMKESDRVIYAGFFSMVALSLTLIIATAFEKQAVSSWMWIAVPALVTIALMLTKILYARKLDLPFVHIYGDIVMFILVPLICYYSTVYFIIFLWVYEVAYMMYMQFSIVEEDI